MTRTPTIRAHGPAPRATRRAGGHHDRRRPRQIASAFTIIEILIVVVILGILAAFVVPQFSNASLVARENSLKDDLRYLRTQILVFKAQHRDSPPGYPGGNTNSVPTEADFIAQMTKASNERCQVNLASTSAFPLGPYIQKMPPNPLNGQTAVMVIRNGLPLPTTYQGANYGWIYKPETQEIIANSDKRDGNGVPYMQY